MITATSPLLRLVASDSTDTADLIDRFTERFPNRETAARYGRMLRHAQRDTGARCLTTVDSDRFIRWCAAPDLANNSVRGRKIAVVAFLRWCRRQGITAADPEPLTAPDSPLRIYRTTYGRAQAKNPGRWLTYDEAYGRLIGACQDGTETGLRDEGVIRFGLLAMRAVEIARLPVSAWSDGDNPFIRWTGKGRKPRTAEPGDRTTRFVRAWLTAYEAAIGQALTPNLPLFCRSARGSKARRIEWGQPLGGRDAVYRIVRQRAALAGLGHVATHDLKRTNAGILHRAVTPEGAHFFDLRDIQKVHGHSDPGTTVRSYIEPMDTDVIARAGVVLD